MNTHSHTDSPGFDLYPPPTYMSDISLDDAASISSYDSEEEYKLAQEEWEESLRQLQQLFSIVLLPFFGKWLGRRWSHIGLCSLLRSIFGYYSFLDSICAIPSRWFGEELLLWRRQSV